MNDKPDDLIVITDPHKVPSIFVNSVCGSGFLHHVVNLTFATAQFTPAPDGTIDPDLIVTARLRMDISCAQQLRDTLDRILQQLTTKPDGESAH